MSNRTMTANARNNQPRFDDEHETDDHGRVAQVISDPNAVVDGKTISEWARMAYIKQVHTPYSLVPGARPGESALNDPRAEFAAAINDDDSRMYFITGAPGGTERHHFIESGQDVFHPITSQVDIEGNGIDPTLPGVFPETPRGFMLQVQAALGQYQFFANVTIDDKPVTNLKVMPTTMFDAGIAEAGTPSIDAVGAVPGASLATAGIKGIFAVYEGLSEGIHKVVSNTHLVVTPYGETTSFTTPEVTRINWIHVD